MFFIAIIYIITDFMSATITVLTTNTATATTIYYTSLTLLSVHLYW